MSFKSSYNGLKRTNWDNKTDRQKAKTLQKHFEKLGYKIPQYLTQKSLGEVNFQKALNRIEKGYMKQVSKENANSYMKNFNKNSVNKAYSEYSKAIKKDSSDFVNNLISSGYHMDVIQSLKDDSITLTSKYFTLNKPKITPYTKEQLINMAKRQNMHPVELMEKMKRNTISYKENEMRDRIIQLIDSIYSSKGYGLMNTEINKFTNMLTGQDYMGLSLTIQALNKRQEREDFVDYDLRRGTSDRNRVNEQMEELLLKYNKVRTRVMIKANKEYY